HHRSTSLRLLAYQQHFRSPDPPQPLFTYVPKITGIGKPVTVVHVPFSSSSDVFWRWSKSRKVWLRYHGDVPHTLSNGTQVSAKKDRKSTRLNSSHEWSSYA